MKTWTSLAGCSASLRTNTLTSKVPSPKLS
jgi:hypothetical protein